MILVILTWFLICIVVPIILLGSEKEKFTFLVSKGNGDSGDIYRGIKGDLVSSPHPNVTTLYSLLQHTGALLPNVKLFGARSILNVISEEKQVTKIVHGESVTSTKTWKFFELSSYHWMTYAQVLEKTRAIGSGLKYIGLKSGEKLTLFAATSRDWMLMAHGAFHQNITITTAYDTLGEEGLCFSLNEGEITTLFTNADLLSILPSVAQKVPTLKNVVYSGKPSNEVLDELCKTSLKLYTVDELSELGKRYPSEPNPPQPSDVCCIMYTSGSTGNPKGVVLTHANIVAVVAGADMGVKGIFGEDEAYLAYLPLAHVLEFAVEHFCIYSGIRIGYGNPRTLTDASVRNCKGDIRELCPSFMAGVPAVWETIRKAVVQKLQSASPAKRAIFNGAFKLKSLLKEYNLPHQWLKVVFKPIQDQVGGKLKLALTGGAPMAAETQHFFNVTLCPVVQGYGMTESGGSICLQRPSAVSFGTVGSPVPNCEVKLVAVENTSYHPRHHSGEIWARGPGIMKGYYKQEKLTRENLTEDGWLMTGDIGKWKNGSLAIIDRKKNLVKLANGEYVAIEKLESQYKTSSFVSNICIHADPHKYFIVALIYPVEAALKPFAQENLCLSDLCNEKAVREAVINDLKSIAVSSGFKPAEFIGGVTLVSEEWTPQNGLLTAAQKLKRRDIVAKYKTEIDQMYHQK